MEGTSNRLPYDETDPKSIELYAKELVEKSLRDVLPKDVIKEILEGHNKRDKGSYGNIVQERYFGIPVNSDPEPDFKKAGVELKNIPLKYVRKNRLVPKERLVLGIIDYEKMADEVWEKSTFLKKNKLLLLMFYLYEKGKLPVDLVTKLASLWEYPVEDLRIIKKDWETIVAKIKAKKAHELSEGDTFYLGACTKGSDATQMKSQKGTDIMAKQRALSLKQSYLRVILETLFRYKEPDVEPILKVAEGETVSDLEQYILDRFRPYIGMKVEDIEKKLSFKGKEKSKDHFAWLAREIMGVKKKRIAEFEKADVQMKIIRLKNNGVPKESMSFPHFKYMEIIGQNWYESDLRQTLSKKFFFVVYKYNQKKELHLEKVMFWNMPFEDIEGAVKSCWDETVKRIVEGKADKLPKSSENDICHVRPHGRDNYDKIPAPRNIKVVKKSFWINSSYLARIINNNVYSCKVTEE